MYQFRARDVHLVMGPGGRRAPHTASTIDAGGHGTLTAQRLYRLIRQPGPVTGHTLEIEFPGPGPEGYVFTVG